jgi:hypothetical protein
MNYKIITDEKILIDFIDNFLPELQTNECYYFCLFARSKYAKNEDGSNKFPHIKTDKAQLKRFIAANKSRILSKIKQLEVPIGAYKTKDGDDIPQESLALYINPGPRNQKKAMFTLMKKFIEIQEGSAENFNINAEALSAIQKSRSRKGFVDFDIDLENAEAVVGEKMHYDYINKEAVHFLKTRGGMHILVDTSKIEKRYEHKWYQFFANTFTIDVKGDNMIPVPGTYQGGFTPHFIQIYHPSFISLEDMTNMFAKELAESWVPIGATTSKIQGGAGLVTIVDEELGRKCVISADPYKPVTNKFRATGGIRINRCRTSGTQNGLGLEQEIENADTGETQWVPVMVVHDSGKSSKAK